MCYCTQISCLFLVLFSLAFFAFCHIMVSSVLFMKVHSDDTADKIMKKYKFIVWIAVVLISTILVQENIAVYYSYAAFTFPSTFIEASGDEIREIIDYCIKRYPNNVSLFFMQSINSTLVSTDEVYYASDEKSLQALEDKKIYPVSYRTLMDESQNISVRLYDDEKQIYISSNIPIFFVTDDYELLQEVIDDINEHFDRELVLRSPDTGMSSATLSIIATWIAAGIVLIALTLYDIAFQRKSVLLKIIHGEKRSSIILAAMAKDTGFLVIGFSVIFLLSCLYYRSFIFFKISLCAISIICVVNSLLYLSFLNINPRAVLANTHNKRLTYPAYIVRIIICCVIVPLLSVTLTSVKNAVDIIGNIDYFSKYQDKSFLEIQPAELNADKLLESVDKINKLQISLFTENYESAEPLIITELARYGDTLYVLANEKAKDMLCDSFPEISDKKFAVFIPKTLEHDSLLENDIDRTFNDSEIKPEIVYYTDKRTVNLLNRNFDNESLKSINPILFYCNAGINPKAVAELFFPSNPNVFSNILFSLKDYDTEKLYDQYSLYKKELQITKAIDLFLNERSIAVYSMTIYSVLSCLFFAFYYSVIVTLSDILCAINAKEIAIKKLMGYTELEAVLPMVIPLLCTSLSLWTVPIASLLLNSEETNVTASFISAALAFSADIICVAVLLHKKYLPKTSKILKNGFS